MIVENPYSHTAALIIYHQEVPPVATLGSYSHLSDEFQVSVALAYVVILEMQSLGGLSLSSKTPYRQFPYFVQD